MRIRANQFLSVDAPCGMQILSGIIKGVSCATKEFNSYLSLRRLKWHLYLMKFGLTNGQLVVGDPIILIQNALGEGAGRVRHSAYIEVPLQVGECNDFSLLKEQ